MSLGSQEILRVAQEKVILCVRIATYFSEGKTDIPLSALWSFSAEVK